MRKLLVAAALLLAAGAASAGPAPRAHDGLMLQFDVGGGKFSTEAEDLGQTIDGSAFQFSLTIGGALRENLVVGGQLWLAGASDPDVEVDGLGSGTLDGSVNFVGVGPNLTYWFMPLNLYVSATPALTRLTFDAAGEDADGSTDAGFGLRLAVGKEFFLGDNFGLGVNLSAAWASNDDKDNGPTFKSAFYGIALSGTIQ